MRQATLEVLLRFPLTAGTGLDLLDQTVSPWSKHVWRCLAAGIPCSLSRNAGRFPASPRLRRAKPSSPPSRLLTQPTNMTEPPKHQEALGPTTCHVRWRPQVDWTRFGVPTQCPDHGYRPALRQACHASIHPSIAPAVWLSVFPRAACSPPAESSSSVILWRRASRMNLRLGT